VLVVEDDPDIREAMVDLLTRYGYPTVGAEHGRHALDLLAQQSEPPCIILLDLMMPVMDGRAFIAEQKSRPELASIPVVLISAYAQFIDAAKDLDTVAQLKKPIYMPDLLSIIRAHCAPPEPS
jgi:CheY-like chemotaxis protein